MLVYYPVNQWVEYIVEWFKENYLKPLLTQYFINLIAKCTTVVL